jgi:hypothetical protein
MPSKRFLRSLIVAEIAVGILYIIVSFFSEASLPAELRAYEEAQSEASLTRGDFVQLAVAIPLVIAALLARIGLFFFWRFARPLFLITLIADVLLTPLFGVSIETGWGQMLDQAAVVVSGVVLALIYFSPLRTLYEKAKEDA